MMKKIRVVVLMGGPSSEYEVSLASGRGVIKALDAEKYHVLSVVIPKDDSWRPDGLAGQFDVAFLALHGSYGEDGTIQGFLDMLNIPYTGSGVMASALCMNKAKAMAIVADLGLAVPGHKLYAKANEVEVAKLELPCVVLPNASGSSVGVSICHKPEDLPAAIAKAGAEQSGILISEFIEGIEVTVPILNNQALPIVEIIPQKGEFYDYASKYEEDGSDHIIPARLPEVVAERVRSDALTAFKALGCRDYARIDFIVKSGVPYFLEANSLPGMTPTSLLPDSAKRTGISYADLVDKMIDLALKPKP